MIFDAELSMYDVMTLGIVSELAEFPSNLAPLARVIDAMPLRHDRLSPFKVLAALERNGFLVKLPMRGVGLTRKGWIVFRGFASLRFEGELVA